MQPEHRTVRGLRKQPAPVRSHSGPGLLFPDAIATTAKAKNSSSGYRPPGRCPQTDYPQILLQTHYSLRWPALRCDYFRLSPVEGEGNGESLRQFPLEAGDYTLADRGYCHASGIHYAAKRHSQLTVRLNPDGIVLQTPSGEPFNLLKRLKPLRRTGQIANWNALVPWEEETPVAVRVCVIRKSKAAIALAREQLRRKAVKQGSHLQAETLIYAEYVMVLTTFPEAEFPAPLVLEDDRISVAGRTGLQAFQADRPTGPLAQTGSAERQSMALRQAVCGAAHRQGPGACACPFPLGVRRPSNPDGVVAGGSLPLCSANCSGR